MRLEFAGTRSSLFWSGLPIFAVPGTPFAGSGVQNLRSKSGSLAAGKLTRFNGVSPKLRNLRWAAAVWVHSAGKRNSRLSVGGNSFAEIGAPPARPASFLELGFAALRACSVRSFSFGSGFPCPKELAFFSSGHPQWELASNLGGSGSPGLPLRGFRLPVQAGAGGTEGEPRNLLPGSSPSRRLPGLRPWNFGKPAPRCLWPRGCRPRRAELPGAVPGLPSRELRISSLSRREALPARGPPRLKSGSLAAGS